LIESELFGYVDGAFTGALKGGRLGKFELADSGTLLLDEIGDMPHNMQVKLLRVLQTGEIQPVGSSRMLHLDVRIIAATHVNLVEAVVQNSFRQDLYYRLNIMTIRIPPLRERGCGDIEALARHFISRNRPGCRLGTGALQLLCDYGWPGNVRELENTIQRALHLCEGDQLLPGHFELAGASCVRYPMRPGTLRELERQNIAAALAANGANMAKTARQLGISRATLYRKVKEYALAP
jgi:transcriptional regulator with PAS, ATPase and Fis domain